MYLNRLSEKQKELFLDLCIHASKADGVFAEEEKACIKEYCVEMQLEQVRYSSNNDLDATLKKIVEVSTIKDLKIIFCEVVALILSDNVLDKTEDKLITKLIETFHLNVEFKEEIIAKLKTLQGLYAELTKILFE